jgi:hypothetical protein
MQRILLLGLFLACSSPAPVPERTGPEPPAESASAADSPNAAGQPESGGQSFAEPPPGPSTGIDDGVPLAGAGHLSFRSDCSLTHPIARDPCSGVAASDRGLASCDSLGVAPGQACGTSSPSCYLTRACQDGRQVVADYLVCADKAPSRCLTRSSRRYKDDVQYLSVAQVRELARQIEALPLATFRYHDQVGYRARLGFVTEDAPAAPFVSEDGRTVDLYALLAASIAAIQAQDSRIRALEEQVRACKAPAAGERGH